MSVSELVDELRRDGEASHATGMVHAMSRPSHNHETAEFARDLRQEMPWSEARLWSAIRNRQAGARFRRQVPIGHYVADFASLRPKLVIEIDGDSHDWADETARTSYIESKGFTVLRFDNYDVRDNLDGVCARIEEVVSILREDPSGSTLSLG